MSRPKPRHPTSVIEKGHDPDESALRAELDNRLDQLRATIEAKRREGWTVVRSPPANAAPPPHDRC